MTFSNLKSYSPKVSMSAKAKFVVFKGLETPILGPLTSRKIVQYQLSGFYGPHAQAAAQASKRKSFIRTQKKTMDELYSEYAL